MMEFIYYLIKVVVCSGCLFFYYQLALKNKVFHQWNRFYLLAGVVLSLLLPLVQIMVAPAAEENKAVQLLQVVQSADNYLEEMTVATGRGFTPELGLTAGYIAISSVFLIALFVSLVKIRSILARYKSRSLYNIHFVNTREPGTPFSFFRFIFWNEDISLQTETGQQIFQHELVHVQERHTLDKLFMQLVLILFWVNPFFWLIRRELKFIHEFIADRKSVGALGAPAFAAMILQTAYPHQYHLLTNPFFQTAIKRRIKMLTKIQNPKRAYLSRIIALPIIAVIAFAFTVRTKEAGAPVVALEKEIVVVIDAGHGKANGNHTGAVDGEVYEDDVVLALAKKIREENKNDRIKIFLTRSDENSVDLKSRVAVAERVKADMFISLHLNALTDKMAQQQPDNGIEVYVSNKNTLFQKQSELLGSAMQEELQKVYKTNPALIKRKVGVWVLDQNVCPAIIVECGYITNDQDRAFLAQEKNKSVLAQQILGGIQQYAATFQSGKGVQLFNDTIPSRADSIQPLADINTATPATKKFDGLVIINGQPSIKKIKDVNNAAVESMNVLSGKEAITKYGEKGKNGAIEITLKKEEKITIDGPHRKPASEPLVVVDGKELGTGKLNTINPNTIQSINILKDQTAIAKYGEKGKDGVIEITSKGTPQSTTPALTEPVIAPDNSTSAILPMRPVGDTKKFEGIYVVDGEIYTGDVHKIDAATIQSMNVLKGKAATDKWGEKGKDGVIEITIKKHSFNNVIIKENNQETGKASGNLTVGENGLRGNINIENKNMNASDSSNLKRKIP